MTTRVELRKVTVAGPNPAKFDEPITLNVVLEVFEKLPEHPIDVAFTWSPVWDFPVDQELDEFEVGPFASLGVHEFVLQSDAPDFSQIPDPTGPTALLVTLSYQGRQFLHIGYHVIVSCEGDIPDVFTTAASLSRSLERCFPRQTVIVWDSPAADAAKADAAASASESSEVESGSDADDEEEEEEEEEDRAGETQHGQGSDGALKKARTESPAVDMSTSTTTTKA